MAGVGGGFGWGFFWLWVTTWKSSVGVDRSSSTAMQLCLNPNIQVELDELKFYQLAWADSHSRRPWKNEMASRDISRRKYPVIWEIGDFVTPVKILATRQQVVPYSNTPSVKMMNVHA